MTFEISSYFNFIDLQFSSMMIQIRKLQVPVTVAKPQRLRPDIFLRCAISKLKL